MLEATPSLSEPEAIYRERVEYVFSGESYERPQCPRCDRDLDSEWVDVMGERYDDGFARGFA